MSRIQVHTTRRSLADKGRLQFTTWVGVAIAFALTLAVLATPHLGARPTDSQAAEVSISGP